MSGDGYFDAFPYIALKKGMLYMKGKKSTSLQKRLYMLSLVCLVPLVIMIMYLLFLINRFSYRYDEVADNLTVANTYNMRFKEKMDYTMYIIVVNRGRAGGIMGTEQPHVMIKNAHTDFNNLYNLTNSEYAKSQLSGILKCLDTLEDRVSEIEEDAMVSGAYDKNMERLDLNIRVITDLIQERIQEYIYFETTQLDTLREGIRKDALLVVRTSIFVFIAILLGVAMFSRRIMKSITVPIRRLSEATKQAGRGDFAVRAQEDSDDELAVLNTSFNRMVERIGQLVEHIQLEQVMLRQTELKVLQAQINPHFLYNTLESIIWLAEAGKTEEVVMMVSSLSDFFRTTLSKGKDYITLQEEEKHIRSYLQIQKFRYNDILEYEIDIPSNLYQYRILKLTLQPLVENALYHGIKNKRGGGHIWVSAREEESEIVLCVKDDGIGMKQEQLFRVRELISKESLLEEELAGFGLYNVNQRLQLNYGLQYGLKIESNYGEGTSILIAIPK